MVTPKGWSLRAHFKPAAYPWEFPPPPTKERLTTNPTPLPWMMDSVEGKKNIIGKLEAALKQAPGKTNLKCWRALKWKKNKNKRR